MSSAGQSAVSPAPSRAGSSLRALLNRLIWLCILPPLLLAAWLAAQSVRGGRDAALAQARTTAGNLALAVDQRLQTRISGLNMLALSDSVDNPADWPRLYAQAKAYETSFGAPVIFAPARGPRPMLFNTRVPYGEPLPNLPVSDGRSAAPLAASSGEPQVGDIVFGPVVKRPLVAIAVPVKRQGVAAYLMLSTMEAVVFKEHLDRLTVPDGWSVSLLDGTGKTIAQRGPEREGESGPSERVSAPLELSRWQVAVDIPRRTFVRPMLEIGLPLVGGLLAVLLIGYLAGRVTARRLEAGVAGLAAGPDGIRPSGIVEIDVAQARLSDAARQSATDSAARHRAEADSRVERSKLEAALASMNDAVLICDADGRFVEFNDAFATFHRFPDKAVCARSLDEYPALLEVRSADGELLPFERWPVPRALRGELLSNVEFVLCRRDSGERWVGSYSVAPIRDAGGAIVGAVFVGRDVSERKAAEAAIVASEQSLRLALDAAKAGTWEWDLATGRNFWSAEVFRLYGLEPGACEPSFEAWLASVHPEDRERAAQAARDSGGAGKDLYIEWRVALPDDEVRWLLSRGRAEYDAAGCARRYLGVVLDISERKRAEAELEQHRHHLLDLVGSRTAELAAAKAEAEAANHAKSLFLANMSHEIRTPMNAIIGLTHLVQRAGLPEREAERVGKIESAGRHLLSIINDILDISKIEAGRLELESTDFHLSAVLDNVQSLIAEQAAAKGLAISIDPDSVPLWLRGDPTRLRQALLNFAGNAVKFTEHGSIALRAVLIEEGRDGLLVRFEVEDTGIGIPEAAMANLFQAFEQADPTTTRRFGGTGLGLVITRRLAEIMGGEAGGESTPGVGSRFWFTTRLQRGHGIMPARVAQRPADAEASLRAHAAGWRLLLAEDNEINREVALELLHSVGLSADTAVNGAEAVARAGAARYDLILMDMQMPELDGPEATRRIRALAGGAEVPVIAMTANAFDEDRQRCAEAGMNDFIAKPVDPADFFAILAKWLLPAVDRQPLSPAAEPGGAGAAAPPPELALPGIDTARGLAYVRGKRDFYLHLLRLFRDQQARDFVADFRQARVASDWNDAVRRAHTLKGLARSIGATRLAELAAGLEAAAKREALYEVVAEEIALEQELGRLIPGLDTLGSDDASDGSPGRASATTDPRRLAVEHFAALLEAGDTAALGELETLAGLFVEDRDDRTFAALRQAVLGFDYDAALRFLRQLAERSGAEGSR